MRPGNSERPELTARPVGDKCESMRPELTGRQVGDKWETCGHSNQSGQSLLEGEESKWETNGRQV